MSGVLTLKCQPESGCLRLQDAKTILLPHSVSVICIPGRSAANATLLGELQPVILSLLFQVLVSLHPVSICSTFCILAFFIKINQVAAFLSLDVEFEQ